MNSKPVYKPLPEDLKVIAAMPCLDSMKLGYVPYKNSEVQPCGQCGQKCFVGPESMKLHKTGVAIVCVICLAKEYGPEAVQKMMRPLTDKKMGE